MKTLVFITGFNYSGSTLLALLLGNHPEITTTGEIEGPPNFHKRRDFLCSCRNPIVHCPFYKSLEKTIDVPSFRLFSGQWGTRLFSNPPTIVERLHFGSFRNTTIERFRDFSRNRAPFTRKLFENSIDLNKKFIEAACSIMGKSIIVDSSKTPMRIPLLVDIPGVVVKVIHLVRHPAGCVMSAGKHNGHASAFSADLWLRNFRTCERMHDRFRDVDWLRLRYEDLCEQPVRLINQICEFLEVPFDERMFSVNPLNQHIVGNDMRMSPFSGIELNERWRQDMNGDDLKNVVRVTGSMLNLLGYDMEKDSTNISVG